MRRLVVAFAGIALGVWLLGGVAQGFVGHSLSGVVIAPNASTETGR